MSHFFTSDTHFGHYNIIRYCERPFPTSDDMDNELIHQINSMVGPDDILWHLGDFSMYHHSDRSYFDRCKNYRDRIRCNNINLIWGNHDNESISCLFNRTYHLKELRIEKFPMMVLCHYAMAIWNKSHHGSINLYGHSHSSAESWLNEALPERRSMDVGVDHAAKVLGSYRPWSMTEILDYLPKSKGHKIDYHGK